MSLWYWFTYMSQAIRGSIWCFWGVRWLTAGQQVTWAQFWTQKVDFGSSYCTYSGAKSCSLPGRLNPCFWLAVQEKGLGCKPFLCQKLWKDLETGRNCQNLTRCCLKYLNMACSSPFSQITGLFENLQIYWEKIALWSFFGSLVPFLSNFRFLGLGPLFKMRT